jgi:hypothetical protein
MYGSLEYIMKIKTLSYVLGVRVLIGTNLRNDRLIGGEDLRFE